MYILLSFAYTIMLFQTDYSTWRLFAVQLQWIEAFELQKKKNIGKWPEMWSIQLLSHIVPVFWNHMIALCEEES